MMELTLSYPLPKPREAVSPPEDDLSINPILKTPCAVFGAHRPINFGF
jgi:hypothetical protein